MRKDYSVKRSDERQNLVDSLECYPDMGFDGEEIESHINEVLRRMKF